MIWVNNSILARKFDFVVLEENSLCGFGRKPRFAVLVGNSFVQFLGKYIYIYIFLRFWRKIQFYGFGGKYYFYGFGRKYCFGGILFFFSAVLVEKFDLAKITDFTVLADKFVLWFWQKSLFL